VLNSENAIVTGLIPILFGVKRGRIVSSIVSKGGRVGEILVGSSLAEIYRQLINTNPFTYEVSGRVDHLGGANLLMRSFTLLFGIGQPLESH
jgi:hypothetical protein